MNLHPEVRKHFSSLGKKGGAVRAQKHSKEELSKWGAMGGRPKVKKLDSDDTQSSSE